MHELSLLQLPPCEESRAMLTNPAGMRLYWTRAERDARGDAVDMRALKRTQSLNLRHLEGKVED